LKESGGYAVSVSDDEMVSAGKEMAKFEGIFAEPASAAPVASLKMDHVRSRMDKGITWSASSRAADSRRTTY